MEEVARVVICRQNAVGKACKREITKMLREWKIWPRAQQVMGLNPGLCTWQASTLPLSDNPSHFLKNFIYLRRALSKTSRLAWSPVGFAFVILCWVYRALSPSPHEEQALGLTSYFLDSQDQFLPCSQLSLYLSDPWLPTSTEFHFTRDPMYSLLPLALHGLRTLAKYQLLLTCVLSVPLWFLITLFWLDKWVSTSLNFPEDPG